VIKVLFIALVLCMLALVGAVGFAFLKVRRQMRTSAEKSHQQQADSIQQDNNLQL
jgi:Tfp pilus assembly protein PilW